MTFAKTMNDISALIKSREDFVDYKVLDEYNLFMLYIMTNDKRDIFFQRFYELLTSYTDCGKIVSDINDIFWKVFDSLVDFYRPFLQAIF